MWITPVVLCICLGLVTSAPTITDQPGGNAPAEDASLVGNNFVNFDSAFDLNDTSAEDSDYGMLVDIFKDMLEDYDTAENSSESLSANSSQNDNTLEDILASEDNITPESSPASGDSASSEETLTPEHIATSEEGTTSKATTTTEQTPTSEDDTSTTKNASTGDETPSPSSSSSSSSSSSAAASEEDDYDYYDYNDVYGDYTPPTAFPFSIFDDVQARPPADGDILPSSCAWAVVQCCNNPDKMGSRISCFSHVGCYGAWMQDFCTPELKKVVFKSVFKSFKFSP